MVLMDNQDVSQKVQDLSDVELAMLLSLTAKEHCIIQTEPDALDALEEEVKLITANVFGLMSSTVRCSEATTLEDFTHGILIDKPTRESTTTPTTPKANYRASAFKFERSYSGELYQVAHVCIVRSINNTAHQVQMQALELLRTHRIFTHTGVYSVPKPFLMVMLSANGSTPLSKHLNDFIFLSHAHTEQEGYPNTEESLEWIEDDRASTSSVLRTTGPNGAGHQPLFSSQDLQQLSNLQEKVVISTEVKRYMHDVLTFLRFHRAVAGGVSPRATRHLHALVQCLAPLHGLAFATPSLVALAARKVYIHRLELTLPENERSMQYGSDLVAVEELLADVTTDLVIEEVLTSVDVPV